MAFFMHSVFLIAMISSVGARATIFTNGGERSADQDNPWFLGPRAIEYCVSTSRGSGFTRPEAQALVRDALNDWREFFAKYGIDRMSFAGVHGAGGALSLQFRETPKCAQPAEQLEIAVGPSDSRVREAIQRAPNALGFAMRGDYDYSDYRTGGLVYVAAFENRAETKRFLLHELGHVFGMTHDSVYVMSEKPGDLPAARKEAAIESPAWPYRLEDGVTIDYSAVPGRARTGDSNSLLSALGDQIWKRAQGFHALTFVLGLASGRDLRRSASLVIEDSGCERVQLDGEMFVDRGSIASKVKKGPSLYMRWPCPDCSAGYQTERRYLDSRDAAGELQGWFERDGVVYPAVLEARPGPILRIGNPRTRRWWSVADYPSVDYWKLLR